MSESWIKVGARCQCVKTFGYFDGPQPGQVFTIDAIGNAPCLCGGIALQFVEMQHRDDCGVDFYWCAGNFRPLVSREQDIAMFNEILAGPKLDVMAEQLNEAWRVSEETP